MVSGHASTGDSEGVKDMLEYLKKKRDGEFTEEGGYRPKWCFHQVPAQ